MDKERIKQKLITEVENQFQKQENQFRKAEGLDKLNAWSEKFGKTPKFSELIVDKLNEILEKENIEFKNEQEKNEFLEYINPTVKDLITKFIRN
tara:strand:- start:603 stop:884 length:282 start_codon:yes stop_codon:yes gene_type:complete